MARLNLRLISSRGDSPAVTTPPSPPSEDARRSSLRIARGCPLHLGVRCRTAPALSCHGLTVAVSARFPVRGSTNECVRGTPLGLWVNGLLCGPSWTRCLQAQHTVPHARATQASSTKLCTNGIGVPCPLLFPLAAAFGMDRNTYRIFRTTFLLFDFLFFALLF